MTSCAVPAARAPLLVVQRLENGATGWIHGGVDGAQHVRRDDVQDGGEAGVQRGFDGGREGAVELALAVVHEQVLQVLPCDAAGFLRRVVETGGVSGPGAGHGGDGGVCYRGEKAGVGGRVGFSERGGLGVGEGVGGWWGVGDE